MLATTGEVVKSAKSMSKDRNEITGTTAEVLECAKAACSDLEEVENAQDKKRIKIGTDSKGVALEASADTEWVLIFNMTLKVPGRNQLLMGEELTDIVNASISMIKKYPGKRFFTILD